MTGDIFSKETIELLNSTKNPQTKKKYFEIQEKYRLWCKVKKVSETLETLLCNWFSDCLKRGTVGVGSLWGRYSAIRSYLQNKHKVNIKHYEVLKELIKGQVKKHMPKKSNFFSEEQIYFFLDEFWKMEDDIDLLFIIIVSLMVFSLLRQCEVLTIKRKDVHLIT